MKLGIWEWSEGIIVLSQVTDVQKLYDYSKTPVEIYRLDITTRSDGEAWMLTNKDDMQSFLTALRRFHGVEQ